jgi:hypothetical protein
MKIQILLTILVLFLLSSCSENPYGYEGELKVENSPELKGRVGQIKIENCDYFCSEYEVIICHKGNCSNPIHNNKLPRDYQIDIKDTIGTLYDGNRVVGKFNLLSSQLDILIYKDKSE